MSAYLSFKIKNSIPSTICAKKMLTASVRSGALVRVVVMHNIYNCGYRYKITFKD